MLWLVAIAGELWLNGAKIGSPWTLNSQRVAATSQQEPSTSAANDAVDVDVRNIMAGELPLSPEDLSSDVRKPNLTLSQPNHLHNLTFLNLT